MDAKSGFTLIELSIVLVVIGLLIGGMLAGQDLIKASGERAQIAQIEKYNSAVNTFRGKYNALPGDLNQAVATQFGFSARGIGCGGSACPGQGDGNGALQTNMGNYSNPQAAGIWGWNALCGETGMFWVDLSYANGKNINLIDGSFNPSLYTGNAWQVCNNFSTVLAATAISQFIPLAKIGHGNYVYVWSGGWQELAGLDNGVFGVGNGTNYFSLGQGLEGLYGGLYLNMGLTVKEAYDIDKKIDDGLPQSGRVMAMFADPLTGIWASALANDSHDLNSGLADGSNYGPVINPGNEWGGDTTSTTTCYDYVKPLTLPVVYSIGGNISPNNSAQVNCALSFQFQ